MAEMKFTLKRYKENKVGTFGTLEGGGLEKALYTLEWPWNNNKTEASRIYPGEYKVVHHNTQNFPDTYELLDVLGRTAILIHIGNTIVDTKGCILVGESSGQVASKKDNVLREGVLYSTKALNKIRDLVKDNEEEAKKNGKEVKAGDICFILEIIDEIGTGEWQKLKLNTPPGAKTLHSGLADKKAPFSKAVSLGREKLKALGLPSNKQKDEEKPKSGNAEEPKKELAAKGPLEALLAARLNFLAITPYNCGERVGGQFLLTPKAALARLEQCLSTVKDWKGQAALCLLLPALDASSMSKALSAFAQVWNTPDLEQLLRQCGSWGTLESDKFKIPEAAPYPAACLDGPTEHDPGRKLYAWLAEECALAEAAEQAAASPAAKLGAFAQERLDKAEAVSSAVSKFLEKITAESAKFNGKFEFRAAYIPAASTEKIRKLNSSPPVEDVHKNCSVFCWWGQPENMTFLKELFGV